MKNCVISRRSMRNAVKRGDKAVELFNRANNTILSVNTFANKEKRLDLICDSYDELSNLFVLYHSDNYIYSTNPRLLSLKSMQKLFSVAFKRIPILMFELMHLIPSLHVKIVNKVRDALLKYKNIYKKTKNANLFKAVLFCHVKIPKDIFGLIMEYYL